MSVVDAVSAGDQRTDPLLRGMDNQATPMSQTLIIFGGSGDLAARKLIPALYNLGCDSLLPKGLAVVGLGRREMNKIGRAHV